MNGRHKAALVLAGYHWVEESLDESYCYRDGGNVPIGDVQLTGDGWGADLFGRWSGMDWPDRSGHCLSGQTRYPTKEAAQRAIEEIAYGLFAGGFKL
jgi:hypothetical protein